MVAFAFTKKIVFVDLAKLASDEIARIELSNLGPIQYCGELSEGLNTLRESDEHLVLLSANLTKAEITQTCETIANGSLDSAQKTVLLLPDTSFIPDPLPRGVIGTIFQANSWHEILLQLWPIARLSNQIDHQQKDLPDPDRQERHKELSELEPVSIVNRLTSSITNCATGGILLVELQNHSNIRQSMGHRMATEVNAAVHARLKTAIRRSDVMSELKNPSDNVSTNNVLHLEGSEITIILANAPKGTALTDVGNRIASILRDPVNIAGRSIPIRCSVGCASWPADGANAHTLLDAASSELSFRHGHGKTQASHFLSVEESLQMEADLFAALVSDEFSLHFQPKYILGETGKPVGAEALLRWHRNKNEWVRPDLFIPLAEATGLIIDIGRWVIQEATKCQRAWISEGMGLIPVSVNVSAQQFNQPDFVSHLLSCCLENNIPTEALELEITESCLIDDPEFIVTVLNDVRLHGFSIALDDFGTGFSSLSYLRTLPLDVLKIDQTFVKHLDGEDYDPSLTAAIIGIGLVLGLKIVAEGIETPEQWRMLSEWGCHQGQGYLMSRPVPCDELGILMHGDVSYGAAS